MTTETKSAPSKIKFTHAENGDICIRNGDTVFSNLLTIGALTKTAKTKYTGDAVYKEYATDAEGLKELQSMNDEAIMYISDAVATLGKMLVYVQRDEMGDTRLDSFGWLVAGIGEILEQLTFENGEISHTLSKLSEQATASTAINTESASKQETIQ